MQSLRLDKEINGQIYHGKYEYTGDKLTTYFYGRDEDDNKVCWYVDDHKPYFYVSNNDGLVKNLEELSKVEFNDPKEYNKLKYKYPYHYEADVSYTQRVLIDKLHDEKLVYPKVVYFDIETNDKMDIISISAMTNDNKEFYNTSIDGFVDFIRDYDIITSWSDFDKKVLDKYVEIPEVYYFDLLKAFRYLWKKPIRNFKLETVAKIIGMEKIPIKPLLPQDLNSTELWIYNRTDTEIIKELDKKFNIINYYVALAYICKSEIEDTFNTTSVVDVLLLRELRNRNKAIRSKRYYERDSYEGAYVYAKPGRYENVTVWDFSSLYPSIMISYNMSFDTIDACGNIEVGNVHFKSDEKGLIPIILTDLRNKRLEAKRIYKETKDEKYNIKQQGLKTIINGIYGQFGYPQSRFYNPVIASSVTKVGRSIIQYVQSRMNEFGFEVVYADTDSLFIQGGDEGLSVLIDSVIDEFAMKNNLKDHLFNMEFEGVWDKCYIKSKKQYILYNEKENILKPVGLGIVRGDTSKLQKDIELLVMKGLLNNKSKLEIHSEVSNILSKIQEYDLEYIGFPKKVFKDKEYKVKTISHRALEYTNKYLGGVDNDEDFLLLYIKSVPLGYEDTDVLAVPSDKSKLDGFKIDYDLMSTKSIQRIKDLILISLNDFEEA